MIVRENAVIGNRQFVYTRSDAGFKIQRDGRIYDEAYDPAELAGDRVYTETDIPVKDVEN